MTTRVVQVEIPRTVTIDDYRTVDGAASDVDECVRQGSLLSQASGTGRVFMLSSTARGGGVAEMMSRVCSLLLDVGVDARWLVLETDEPAFFQTTKRVHNLLHGRSDDGPLDSAVYERVSHDAAKELRCFIEQGDTLIVHDPQPLAAGALLGPFLERALIWRCHIGVPFQNDATRAGWAFLAPWLAPYSRTLFSSERYVPKELAGRGGVLHPSIDPLAHKNRELRPLKLQGVLASTGLLAAPPRPEWTRFVRKAQHWQPGGWTDEPISGLLFAPLIVQISRFDHLKGFPQVLAAFARMNDRAKTWVDEARVATGRAVDEVQRAELILAGPDPGAVADDPEAKDVLEELRLAWEAMPTALAARVHIVKLPMDDEKQNALMVNALQRAATVVVQASLQEGFGLTVTEAMWKGAPVVASNVGGISLQLRTGTDGLLVKDVSDQDALARAIFEQLVLPVRAEEMASAARRHVAEHFLVVRQVKRWLQELAVVIESRDVIVQAVAAKP